MANRNYGGAAFHRSSYSQKWLFIKAAFHWTYTKVHHSPNEPIWRFGELPAAVRFLAYSLNA